LRTCRGSRRWPMRSTRGINAPHRTRCGIGCASAAMQAAAAKTLPPATHAAIAGRASDHAARVHGSGEVRRLECADLKADCRERRSPRLRFMRLLDVQLRV
jgi:hypothetical protein